MTQLRKSFAIVTLTLILIIAFACVKSYIDSRPLQECQHTYIGSILDGAAAYYGYQCLEDYTCTKSTNNVEITVE